MNTDDLDLTGALFCLFKGDPGAGKSIAAASFPDPFIFDQDKRIKSVANYWRPRGKKVEYEQYTTFFQVNEKLEKFKAFCPYKTLIYDGITSGGKQILDSMLSTRSSSAKKNERGGIEFYQIEDYGGEQRGLDIIINNLKHISLRHNVHVIVTAHVLQVEQKDLKGQTTISRSLLTGGKKVAASLPIWFDEAYHFDVVTSMNPDEKPRYTAITHNVGQDWAKTALNLPLRLDFTDGSLYDEIMKHIKGGGE